MSQPSVRSRSNAEWVAALDGGDEAAVAELGAYLRRVLAKVLGRRRDVGEEDLADFVQEALLRIVETLGSFRGDAAFTTWATAVATRVAFTQLRRRAVRERGRAAFDDAQADALGLAISGTPAADDALAGDALMSELARAITTVLSDRQRLAVVAELRGLPTVEIAERLGTSPNALYKLHHDARKKLRAALLDAGFTAEDIRHGATEASIP